MPVAENPVYKSVERAAVMSPVDEPDIIEVQLLEDDNRKADA